MYRKLSYLPCYPIPMLVYLHSDYERMSAQATASTKGMFLRLNLTENHCLHGSISAYCCNLHEFTISSKQCFIILFFPQKN